MGALNAGAASPGPIELPGAVSISRLRVYGADGPDGSGGGTPHVHLVSAEAYVVVGGSGSVQTLDTGGLRETPLSPGIVATFGPGTIHRLLNAGDLEIVTIMQNAGLPESGDAVMTFLPEVLADPEAYRLAAVLPGADAVAGLDGALAPAGEGEDGATAVREVAGEDGATAVREAAGEDGATAACEAAGEDGATAAREAAVAVRRTAALRGWRSLVEASDRGDREPLRTFYRSAARLVSASVPDWRAIVEDGAPRQLERAREALAAIAAGDVGLLESRTLRATEPDGGEPAWGMCGRLTTWRGR